MIDSLAIGNTKLELVTEFFVRAFGLPGINRASPRTATSRRTHSTFLVSEFYSTKRHERHRFGQDPGYCGGAKNLSAVELNILSFLYLNEIKSGMTWSRVVAMLERQRQEKLDRQKKTKKGLSPAQQESLQRRSERARQLRQEWLKRKK